MSIRRRSAAFGLSLAIHVTGLIVLVVPGRLSPRGGTPSVGTRPIGVARAQQQSSQNRRPAIGENKKESADHEGFSGRGFMPRSPALLIPGFTFDLTKIVNRSAELFPFLDLRLSIEPAPDTVADRADHGLVFVTSDATAARIVRPPLRLNPTVLQLMVDDAWSRRSRWQAFQPLVTLTSRYNAEAGDLPALLREYVDQNLLQPYEDTTIPDPRLWTQLGIAADHADFIRFITAYAAQHPSTKATTELLFLLDKLVQASFDALTTLLDTEPSRDLRWTANVNRDAFRFVASLRLSYLDQLEQKRIDRSTLRWQYDAVRLMILRALIRTTPHGYRADDAKFLIGAIHWQQGQQDAALDAWAGMNTDHTNAYAHSSTEILRILHDSAHTKLSPADATAIAVTLADEHDRWLSFSVARLRRFGYAADTF